MSDAGKVRSAKVRAQVLALLGDTPLTQHQIAAQLPEDVLGDMTEGAFYQLLRHMDANGLIQRVKDGKKNLFLKAGAKAVAPSAAKAADAAGPVAKKDKGKSPTNPHMTIDIIKQTGRVRLTLQGMVIEIGIQ